MYKTASFIKKSHAKDNCVTFCLTGERIEAEKDYILFLKGGSL